MKQWMAWGLAGFAALQFLLLLWTWWPSETLGPQLRPVLDFNYTEIAELHISGVGSAGTPQTPVHLIRQDNNEWSLGSLGGFPARKDRVNELLMRLAGLKVQVPISEDPKAHASLGVAENRYSRKFTLGTQTQAVTFYIGQGKGNSVHVRVDGSDAVYLTHGTTAWKLTANQDDFIERIFFEYLPATVSGLRIHSPLEDYEFTLKNGVFSSPQLAPTLALKQDVLTHLVTKMSHIVTRQALGSQDREDYGFANGSSVTVILKDSEGRITERTLYIGVSRDALVPLKVSDEAFYVLASVSNVQGFMDSRLSSFVIETP